MVHKTARGILSKCQLHSAAAPGIESEGLTVAFGLPTTTWPHSSSASHPLPFALLCSHSDLHPVSQTSRAFSHFLASARAVPRTVPPSLPGQPPHPSDLNIHLLRDVVLVHSPQSSIIPCVSPAAFRQSSDHSWDKVFMSEASGVCKLDEGRDHVCLVPRCL